MSVTVKIKGWARLYKDYRECFDEDYNRQVIEESIQIEDGCLFDTAEEAIQNTDGIFKNREYLGAPVCIEHSYVIETDDVDGEMILPASKIVEISDKHKKNPDTIWVTDEFKKRVEELIAATDEEECPDLFTDDDVKPKPDSDNNIKITIKNGITKETGKPDINDILTEITQILTNDEYDYCHGEFGKDWMHYGACQKCNLADVICREEHKRLRLIEEERQKEFTPLTKAPQAGTAIKLTPNSHFDKSLKECEYTFIGEILAKKNHFMIKSRYSFFILMVHLEDLYLPK